MRTELICQNCSKRFFPKGGSLKQKTCSRECGHKYRIKNGGTKRGKKYPHLQRARVGKCLVCGEKYRAVKDFKERKQKYCSRECYEKYWIDNIRPEMKDNPGVKGEDNYWWKGDEAGYSAIHKWVARELGVPSECQHCGSTEKNKYEWCNKDHKYKRNLDDWMRLCTSCHRKYDYKNN